MKTRLGNKRRVVDMSKPIMVHRNLNNDSYSVLQNGIVVGHTEIASDQVYAAVLAIVDAITDYERKQP